MLRALWAASSGMNSQQMVMDTVANNVSNINTPGFKKNQVEFRDLLYSEIRKPGIIRMGQVVENGLQAGNGVTVAATKTNFKEGLFKETGISTDFAISGDAFFEVTLADGSLAYTRAGSFKVDSEGNLVTQDGHRVNIDGSNGEFSNVTEIKVNKEGNISVAGSGEDEGVEEVGRFRLVKFKNPAGLEHIGQNLFKQTENSGEPEDATDFKVIQGHLEMSNVDLAEEMSVLITAQRAYEVNSRSIRMSDELLGMANSMLRR